MRHYEVPDGYRFRVWEDSWLGLAVQLQKRHHLGTFKWWTSVGDKHHVLLQFLSHTGDVERMPLEDRVYRLEKYAWEKYQEHLKYRQDVSKIVNEK